MILNLYWTRHAESCSNLLTMSFQDKIDNQEKSFINNIYKKIIKLYKWSSIFNMHPILSFIGMQHAVKLGMKIKHDQIKFQHVFSSSMIRTILTSLVAFRGTNKTIYVMPHIHEVGLKYFEFISEKPQDINELKYYVEFMKEWISNNWIVNFDDIEVLEYIEILKKLNNNDINDAIKIYNDNKLKSIQKINNIIMNLNLNKDYDRIKQFFYIISDDKLRKDYLRGPPVNYEFMEKNNNADFDKFIDLINKSKDILHINNNDNIICFSHGNAISRYIENNYSEFCSNKLKCKYPMNTKIYHEIIEINDRNVIHKNINIFYEPQKLRKNYKKYEDDNKNICSKDNINFYLHNTSKT